ncbi:MULTISPECIES: hypothetical protein [unclassified Diaminobutyricimonas]|uniref:hypothetical protein n=1 Tax=unclassified Diaminobutyricimonas TaxID=2643261 RepID=UPI0012F4D511|nr:MULTISPECIES: hypothetical protein [unclassified Diaminobutyricimonas]
MPTRRRPVARDAAIGLAVSVGLALSLALVGCSPDAAVPTPPEPTTEPIFASDEEALAAAEQAYAAYVSVSDQVMTAGAADIEPLRSVVSPRFYETEVPSLEEFHAAGYRTTGTTKVRDVRLQQFNPDSTTDVVVIYLCSDVSAVDVLDKDGRSVVGPERPNETSFEIGFDVTSDAPPEIAVAWREPWQGTATC